MPDPIPTFSHVISSLAYFHLVEPRTSGGDCELAPTISVPQSNDALRGLWALRPLVRAGGFIRETALQAAASGDVVAFGRLYVSNVRPIRPPFLPPATEALA